MTMTDQGSAITVDGLGHRYGDREALSRVSFEVRPGEIVGLLGPNGGGKTTLFKILGTLLTPSAGDARIFGHSVTREPARVRERLGVVFQRPSLDTKLTLLENLRHHGHLYGISGPELRKGCEAALVALGLSGRARDRVESLSGGLQRRAELAKALLHRPDLMLLDEPNTGLDPNARREFLAQLEQLSRRDGVTVLLTTHFMEEAERCDRVGILHEGRLVAFEEPHRLKARIGGDVVVVQCRDPEAMRGKLKERFDGDPLVVDGTVRLETPRGHRLVGEIVEAFPGEILSVSWGQPTLDDVFVHLTGRRFEEEAA
jgi:ABC-2 type transport system ATP-binding protein